MQSDAIGEFWDTVDRVYGAYLDATTGFHILGERIANLQLESISTLGITQEELDSRTFYYGRGDPNEPSAMVQHAVPQGELKHRNRKNGENALFLGAMSVVAIYQFWEDRFRSEIAGELGLEREDLVHDVLGDLRLIRIAIIHHGGVAKKQIAQCRVLKWFQEGEQIQIDEDRIFEIVVKLRNLCVVWMSRREGNQ